MNGVLNGLAPGTATPAVLPLALPMCWHARIESAEDALERIARGTMRSISAGFLEIRAKLGKMIKTKR